MNDNEIVSLDVRYQIEQYKGKVQEVVTYVKALEIETKDDALNALDLACDAINLHERIEETRKEIIEPSKQFQAEVNRIAKDFTKNLEAVKESVVEKVEGWKLGSEEVTNLETSKVITTELTEYQYDVKDLMMVPKEYLTVDEARIKLAMKSGIRQIPGLELKKKQKLSIRRK